MEKIKLPNSLRKYIRKEKARIRRQNQDKDVQLKEIAQLLTIVRRNEKE